MAETKMHAFESEEPELIASEVGERTHAELLCMYQDAEENIRFSKLIQWRTMAGALAIFVLFALLAPEHHKDAGLAKILAILSLLVAMASIYTLAIFQSWQAIEREKIQLIIGNLSSLVREIHDKKSKLAADIERYILLCFMCCAILIGSFLTLCLLMRWFAN